MAIGGKIFFVGSVIAAVLIMRASAAAPAPYVVPFTPYVPPVPPGSLPNALPPTLPPIQQQSGNQNNQTPPPTLPQQNTSLPGIVVFGALKSNFPSWKAILSTPSYGLTHIRSAANVVDAHGHIIQSALLPIQQVSSVYLYLGCEHFYSDCQQQGSCAFPVDVYQSADGYYITILKGDGQGFSTGVYGAALYDPNMKYLDKVATPQIDNGFVTEIFPPLSPEHATSNQWISCTL